MALEDLQSLRDDYENEAPEVKALCSFKVRAMWWQGLILALEFYCDEEDVADSLRVEIANFIERYSSDEFKNQTETYEKDIKAANTLLDRICGPRAET